MKRSEAASCRRWRSGQRWLPRLRSGRWMLKSGQQSWSRSGRSSWSRPRLLRSGRWCWESSRSETRSRSGQQKFQWCCWQEDSAPKSRSAKRSRSGQKRRPQARPRQRGSASRSHSGQPCWPEAATWLKSLKLCPWSSSWPAAGLRTCCRCLQNPKESGWSQEDWSGPSCSVPVLLRQSEQWCQCCRPARKAKAWCSGCSDPEWWKSQNSGNSASWWPQQKSDRCWSTGC